MVSCIKDIQAEVDMVIMGENEQRILSGSILRNYKMGATYEIKDGVAYLPRTFNYEGLEHIYKKNQQCGVTVEKDLNLKKIFTVTEPVIDRESFWCETEKEEVCLYVYQPMKKPKKRKKLKSSTFEYHGDIALQEGQGDLALSYSKALNYFVTEHKTIRSIAFLPLGIATGFPCQVAIEVAIRTVCDYVKKRPYDYKQIWLCVVKKSDDDSYPDNSHDMVYVKCWMELLKQSHN
jgi:hypothetical protein